MLGQIVLFLADAILGFFCLLFLLRFFMQMARVSFAGQPGGFIVQLTNWAVLPLRRVIPGLFGLDMSSLFAALIAQAVLMALIISLRLPLLDGGDPAEIALFVLIGALRGLLRLSLHILIGALILQAVLSWINPYAPLAGPINQLTRPFLTPIRRVVPPVSGIDLSPLVLILLVQVLLMVL